MPGTLKDQSLVRSKDTGIQLFSHGRQARGWWVCGNIPHIWYFARHAAIPKLTK